MTSSGRLPRPAWVALAVWYRRSPVWLDSLALVFDGKLHDKMLANIEEAQALSDRVGIIDYGELIALDTPEELIEKHQVEDLEAVFLKITGRRIAEGS